MGGGGGGGGRGGVFSLQTLPQCVFQFEEGFLRSESYYSKSTSLNVRGGHVLLLTHCHTIDDTLREET